MNNTEGPRMSNVNFDAVERSRLSAGTDATELPSDTELLQFLIDNHAALLNLPKGGSRAGIAEALRRQAASKA
jgi:hypothetical protein